MDKLPVGQLPDLTQSNNDDEIMVITNSEYNQLKKEKISDLITDFTSTNENNALTKGTDGKMFVTDFGNASNITEGTLPTSVLPEIPLEKIPDIPKDKLPPIETSDLPVSGVTADTYAYPSSVTVNAQGQVTAIEAGEPGANNANQDLSNISEAGKEVIRQNSGGGMPVGTIFCHACSASFLPENSLPCNGGEYTQAQFPALYTDWLINGNLNTCTYEEYESDISAYGKCAKFGLDSTSGKFKVPTIPDGTHIQQAMSDDELGKSYNAGLPNIKGSADINRLGYNAEGSVTGAFGLGTSNKKPSAIDTRLEDINTVLKFDASLSNPIYSDDVNTVQTEAVALRYFVVVATGAINESEMNWSEWATGLQGKANVDMNNLSTTGKAEVTSYAFPSSKYDVLEVGVSGETYVAPADGWFYVNSYVSGSYILIDPIDKNNKRALSIKVNGLDMVTELQVYKGEEIALVFTGNWEPQSYQSDPFRFYYAQGVSND